PLEGVETMRAALARDGASAASRASDIVVYPEAGHGFHADYRASYRREDAEDAFKRAIAFFRAQGLALQGD
ncbi:MAG: dienelactone hydrolase family protein, partial [Gammaproteobacteria bacterium]